MSVSEVLQCTLSTSVRSQHDSPVPVWVQGKSSACIVNSLQVPVLCQALDGEGNFLASMLLQSHLQSLVVLASAILHS